MRVPLGKPILLALAITMAASSLIEDDLGWSAPGWYGMAGAKTYHWIVSGPFDDEKSCADKLPASDQLYSYSCTFLNVETPL
jgi:hypothetical protein